jgi:hypothetical protein
MVHGLDVDEMLGSRRGAALDEGEEEGGTVLLCHPVVHEDGRLLDEDEVESGSKKLAVRRDAHHKTLDG